MNMFTNYNNIPDDYVPNNLVCSFPVGKSYTKLDPCKSVRLYEEYDKKGNLIGYSWNYGETLNLEFNIEGEVIVESTAIVYTASKEAPDNTTVGFVGQRAYNVTDLRSWTCAAVISDEHYIWIEDTDFEHSLNGATESIRISASDFLSDKELKFELLNFRHEPIYTNVYKGTSKLVVDIDKELSSKLVKGVYYCEVSAVNNSCTISVFTASDCVLLVK